MTFVHCSPRICQEGKIGSVQYTTHYKNIYTCANPSGSYSHLFQILYHTDWLWKGHLTFSAQLPCVYNNGENGFRVLFWGLSVIIAFIASQCLAAGKEVLSSITAVIYNLGLWGQDAQSDFVEDSF